MKNIDIDITAREHDELKPFAGAIPGWVIVAITYSMCETYVTILMFWKVMEHPNYITFSFFFMSCFFCRQEQIKLCVPQISIAANDQPPNSATIGDLVISKFACLHTKTLLSHYCFVVKQTFLLTEDIYANTYIHLYTFTHNNHLDIFCNGRFTLFRWWIYKH